MYLQGIDVPGIVIVVQWKATCDLSTLWQRFGRAARAAGDEATAILFVEKKDTAEEQELRAMKEANKGKGKRKATTQGNNPPKRRALGDAAQSVNSAVGSLTLPSEEPSLNGDDEAEFLERDAELREERRAHYRKRVSDDERKVEVGSPMYDFINAQCHLKCRRLILTLYFNNDMVCE